MPTSYVSEAPGLEFRKPVKIFGVLGWLAAGVLNPAGWFAYMVWGLPAFDYTIWAWHVAVPLELGLLLAMMYLREGGYGIGGVTGITLICILAACTGTAPVYTLITWTGQQMGFSLSFMGQFYIYDWWAAIAHTGTYIRASLGLAGVAALPAILILRVVAMKRMPLRKIRTSPSARPPGPAA